MWDTYYGTSVVGYNIRGFVFENSLGSGVPGALRRFGCGDNTNFTNIVYSFSSDDSMSLKFSVSLNKALSKTLYTLLL